MKHPWHPAAVSRTTNAIKTAVDLCWHQRLDSTWEVRGSSFHEILLPAMRHPLPEHLWWGEDEEAAKKGAHPMSAHDPPEGNCKHFLEPQGGFEVPRQASGCALGSPDPRTRRRGLSPGRESSVAQTTAGQARKVQSQGFCSELLCNSPLASRSTE